MSAAQTRRSQRSRTARPSPDDAAEAPMTVAAVDLGSNSFHMVIGRAVDGDLQILDRFREHVCIAAGLDEQACISEEALTRALGCLERMGQRLRSISSGRVRAVGTNTLRRAKNAVQLRARCEAALGHPIEIISGPEEARLIYLGVVHSRFSSSAQLVVDIGGGSTEIILGEGFQVLKANSLFMGCVGHTRKFFPDGALKRESFRKAEIAARLELRTIEQKIRGMGWENCLGASGTIHAIHEVLRASQWSEGQIDTLGLKRLRKAMIEAGHVDRLVLPGLKEERARVLPGGLAILRAIFKSLRIESMTPSAGALREGVLYDLLGRIRHEDVRDQTIGRLVERYNVDLGQAARVERTALRLLGQIETDWEPGASQIQKLLIWTSRLHETGLAVSHTGFHKHGAYLVGHGDMPGFSADDQAMLAALIGGHRRKISRSLFGVLSPPQAELAMRLCVLFRLAVLLNRSRASETVPQIRLAPDWKAIELVFPEAWSERHPLTLADLEREAAYLVALEIQLKVRESGAVAAQTA